MFKTMSKTGRLFTWASLGCLLLAGSSQASTLLLGWDFTAAGAPAATVGAAVTVGSTTNDPGIQASTIDAGLGLYIAPLQIYQGRGAMNDQSYGGGGWSAPNLTTAHAGNDYFQWTATPASGYQMSLSSLDLVTYGQVNTGTVVVEYSLDGFATAGTSVGTINPVSANWTGTNTNLSLAGFANLQNATATVTFRAYGYGFGSWEDKGLGQIPGNNTDVGINGTATLIPEPASLGLGLLGLGIIALDRRRGQSV